MNTRAPNENESLMNSDCIIPIYTDEKSDTNVPGPDRISFIHKDLINLISSKLPFNNDLANLRLTSTTINRLIENMPAGQLAREANKLKPFILLNWMAKNSNLIEDSILVLSAFAGGTGGIYVGIDSGMSVAIDGGDIPVGMAFGSLMSILLCLFGGGLGTAIGKGINLGVSRCTLFAQKPLDRVNEIRKELSEPIAMPNRRLGQ
jgi:hypothetical protein